MTRRIDDVLFLCTGNSARSILAEAILEDRGEGRFRAHSAGSDPKGRVHPLALEVLREHGHETSRLRSKSWEEFAAPGAPTLAFILTVCDNAAGEACPIWPGRPITAHWGIEDPAAFEGTEEERRSAFQRAYAQLEDRIARFMQLPLDELDASKRRALLEAIGDTASSRGEHD